VPVDSTPGPYLAWIVANGALSSGKPLTIVVLPDGAACSHGYQCARGSCADGVCCASACTAACHSCNLPGSVGTCTLAPDSADPRHECVAPSGGSPACAGACLAGQCAFPGLGTACDLCAVCDGTGRCAATPIDDAACGVIPCSGLSTPCRMYGDLHGSRCAALGVCKPPNDPTSCTAYADLQCDGGTQDDGPPSDAGHLNADAAREDTGQSPGDGAAGDAGLATYDASSPDDAGSPPPADGGGAGVASRGCGCVVGGRRSSAGWLAFALVAPLAARRRARRRRRLPGPRPWPAW
jgi:hypothetical protein